MPRCLTSSRSSSTAAIRTSSAPFWSVATGLPIGPDDVDKLSSRTLETGEAVLLRDPDGGSPDVWITQADEVHPGSQVHLDLRGDASHEQAILAGGGAVVRRMPRWTVLADPEGNQFCLLALQQ